MSTVEEEGEQRDAEEDRRSTQEEGSEQGDAQEDFPRGD
jgi:hypothetical protein